MSNKSLIQGVFKIFIKTHNYSEKKNNKNMSDVSSLDKRFSDIIGDLNLEKNNFQVNYKYSLDQNFKEMNYSEIESKYSLGNINFNINYLNSYSPIKYKLIILGIIFVSCKIII